MPVASTEHSCWHSCEAYFPPCPLQMNKHIRVKKHKWLLSRKKKRKGTGENPIKMWDAEQQFSLHILIWEEFQMTAESRGYTWMIQNVSIFKHITKSQTPWVRTIINIWTIYTCICFCIYDFYANFSRHSK